MALATLSKAGQAEAPAAGWSCAHALMAATRRSASLHGAGFRTGDGAAVTGLESLTTVGGLNSYAPGARRRPGLISFDRTCPWPPLHGKEKVYGSIP